MKSLTKRVSSCVLALCVLLSVSQFAFAADEVTANALAVGDKFTEDGYTYEITSLGDSNNTVNLVRPTDSSPSSYSGVVTVTSPVSHGSVSYAVTGIGYGAFEGSSVTSVSLPDSITTIGEAAFRQCTSLTTMNIPSKVTMIETQTFSGCSSLSSLTISGSITKIGSAAFSSCSALTTFDIPTTVTEIEGGAFSGLGATSLTIPVGFTGDLKAVLMGWYDSSRTVTFADSNSPYSVQDGVLYKGSILEFALDRTITSVEVKDGITEIGESAFGQMAIDTATYAACTSLTSVTMPDTVTKVGDKAFAGCTALSSVTLSNNLTDIGVSAFASCKALTSIKFPDNLTTIGEKAFYYTGLTSVILPEGISTIPTYAFAGTSSLKTVVLPSTLTNVDAYAFGDQQTSKTQVNMDLSGATMVLLSKSAPTFAGNAFGERIWRRTVQETFTPTSENLTVIIPSGAKSSYTNEHKLAACVTDNSTFGLAMSDPTLQAQSATATEANGNTKTFTADVPTGCTLTVTSADPSIATATVGEDGKTVTITSVAEGTTTVTAKITLDSVSYTLVETTATVTVISEDKEPAVVVPATEEPKSGANVNAEDETVKAVIAALDPTASSSSGESEESGTSTGITVTNSTTNNNALVEAAHEKLNENTVSATDGQTALSNAKITSDEGDTVSIVIQPYLDVTILKVEQTTSGEGEAATTTSTLKLEITPMYRTVATYADLDNEEIVLKAEEGSSNTINAVDMNKGGTLPVSGTTTVSIPLPSDFFTGSTAYVTHTKNSRSYVYTGTIAENVLTFENPHGFSTFEITQTNPIVATITTGTGDDAVTTSYASLQDAVDEAENGAEIVVMANNLSATMSGNSRTITVTNGTEGSITVTINGKTETLAQKNATTAFTYTRPSSGGGTITYTVTAPSAVDNGTVTVSPKNASKGSTVTITVKPDDGYELAALTVTNNRGNKLALTDKGDGKYTFTMPASKVNIEASFKEVQAPAPTPVFVDVPADSYYADAVAWAVANGITEGTSDTTFSPNASCTRAQMVTFLWRAAGCPEPAGTTNAFTDVVAGSYYEKAVQWAVEQGITKGTSDTTFSPEETVTRAQTVTFLHRYMNKPDAAGTMPFTDVAANSYYEDAVRWAVDTGVTKGTSDTTFSPDNDCVRAQTVTFLYRALVK